MYINVPEVNNMSYKYIKKYDQNTSLFIYDYSTLYLSIIEVAERRHNAKKKVYSRYTYQQTSYNNLLKFLSYKCAKQLSLILA